MSNIYKSLDNSKYKLEIHYDESPISPRKDSEPLGTMVLTHRKYDLPKEVEIDFRDFASWEEVKDCLIREHDAKIILSVFAYIHSGIALSTSRTGQFADRWDSGQLGFIFCTNKRFEEEGMTEERVISYMETEVSIYNQYLEGEVYGFKLFEKEECNCCSHVELEEIDTCWGFYSEAFDKNGLFDNCNAKEYFTEEELKILL